MALAFQTDAEIIADTVGKRDPSFQSVDARALSRHLSEMRKLAAGTSRDRFLLAAMKLMALAGNAHSRLIPNAAISVLPLRIVALGEGWQITQGQVTGALAGIGDLTMPEIEKRLAPYLAGPASRRRVIGGAMLAWPPTLTAIGAFQGDVCVYELKDRHETKQQLTVSSTQLAPAPKFYPPPEQGFRVPETDPHTPIDAGTAGFLQIRLRSFSDADDPDLDRKVERAADLVFAQRAGVFIDCRGNPGGSFLRALPLLEALKSDWLGSRCAVLVDKFTFSAAIVFVALLSYHLKDRVRVFGEPMGDDLEFWAEGGTINLPQSGAQLRYSDGYHDWYGGDPHWRAPQELARYMVPAGEIEITSGAFHANGPRGAAVDWLRGRGS